jgi:hypothetical protein
VIGIRIEDELRVGQVLLKNKRIHGIDDHLSEIVKRARAAAVGFREQSSAQAWSVVLSPVAVLFNLIVPIYLNRSARFYLDLGAAGLFVATEPRRAAEGIQWNGFPLLSGGLQCLSLACGALCAPYLL